MAAGIYGRARSPFTRRHPYPTARYGPKALHNMVLRPKSLKLLVLRAFGVLIGLYFALGVSVCLGVRTFLSVGSYASGTGSVWSWPPKASAFLLEVPGNIETRVMTFEKHRLAHNLTMSTRLLQGGRLRGWVGGMAELFNIP